LVPIVFPAIVPPLKLALCRGIFTVARFKETDKIGDFSRNAKGTQDQNSRRSGADEMVGRTASFSDCSQRGGAMYPTHHFESERGSSKLGAEGTDSTEAAYAPRETIPFEAGNASGPFQKWTRIWRKQ
jgi:hypothetical protein